MEYLHTFTINLRQKQVDIPSPMERLGKVEGSYHFGGSVFFRFHEHHGWSTNPPWSIPLRNQGLIAGLIEENWRLKSPDHKALFLWECSSLGGLVDQSWQWHCCQHLLPTLNTHTHTFTPVGSGWITYPPKKRHIHFPRRWAMYMTWTILIGSGSQVGLL